MSKTLLANDHRSATVCTTAMKPFRIKPIFLKAKQTTFKVLIVFHNLSDINKEEKKEAPR